MIKYKLFRKDLNKWIDVILVKFKNKDKYSFINLSVGHICECEFDSIRDAEIDLVKNFIDGKIVSIFREYPPEEPNLKVNGDNENN